MINSESIEKPVIGFLKSHTHINIEDFNNTLKIHPTYPSFSSIFDTLGYFSINIEIYEASFEKVDSKYSDFFAILLNEDELFYISHITKKNGKFYSDSVRISEKKLNEIWSDNIFVIEKTRTKGFEKLNKIAIFIAFFFIFYLIFVLSISNTLEKSVFYIGTFCGLTLTALSINMELDLIPSINKFCQSKPKIDCSAVITSNNSKIFNFIKFSEVSFAFFFTQFLFLYLSDLESINLNSIYILFSFPFILFSLYHQLFKVKKYCLICLLISTILIIEFIFLQKKYGFLFDLNFFIKYFSVQIIFIIIISTFRILKKENITSVEKNFKLKRFLNNYSVFNKITSDLNEFEIEFDFLFYVRKPINLTIITDPFCEYCKVTHEELTKVLLNFDENLYNISTIFNVDWTEENSADLLLFSTMINIQEQDKSKFFFKTLTEWFNNRNVELWNSKYKIKIEYLNVSKYILELQYKWCQKYQISQTPTILINGKKLQDCYDIADLKYLLIYLADVETDY